MILTDRSVFAMFESAFCAALSSSLIGSLRMSSLNCCCSFSLQAVSLALEHTGPG